MPIYLAMTRQELQSLPSPPARCAWMACHFSHYGTGLVNLPDALPKGSLITVNDRTPINGHDPETVVRQLEQTLKSTGAQAIIVDFQRPVQQQALSMAQAMCRLPCPVAVSAAYAKELSCEVLVELPAAYQPLSKVLADWQNRPIWLEVFCQQVCVSVQAQGASQCPWEDHRPNARFFDPTLLCSYHTQVLDREIRFFLSRGKEELQQIVQEADRLGIRGCLGLYQQLG